MSYSFDPSQFEDLPDYLRDRSDWEARTIDNRDDDIQFYGQLQGPSEYLRPHRFFSDLSGQINGGLEALDDLLDDR